MKLLNLGLSSIKFLLAIPTEQTLINYLFIAIYLFLDSNSFNNCIPISLVNVQTIDCNNNLLILDVKQLNKIMKLYSFYTLKAMWDGQGKIKMYYGISRVKKQLSGKSSIVSMLFSLLFYDY